jgi:hypothetical protein
MKRTTKISRLQTSSLVFAFFLMAGAGSAMAEFLPAAGTTYPAEKSLTTPALLDSIQRTAFEYFWDEANPVNGLIRDRSQPGSPCSIAAQGFGISAICIAIDHGWVTREEGRARVLLGMQTLWNGTQGDSEFGINGYKGLFYHFLDINSGNRVWSCELSTIDTALLMAGVLDGKQYFNTADPVDQELRALADSLYQRVDWDFMRDGGNAIRMGWIPSSGFDTFGPWVGYNEAMILYILALGSPTHPVPWYSWAYWTTGYNWSTQYGQTYLIFPPLFGHQYSHCWIDFRDIQDEYMSLRGITYHENSRRATLAAREYCIDNPLGWTGYGENMWGLTASDDPDGYLAHGAPPAQNDNGTITPTAAASSIAFAPEIVIPALHYMYDNYGGLIWGKYGFKDAFNLSVFWVGSDYLGIDQGPIVMMIENYLNGSVWDRFMENPDLQAGLAQAGFNKISPVPGDSHGPLTIIELGNNRPNPFTGSTVISYRVAKPGPVTLRVYDLRGRLVRQINDEASDRNIQQIDLDARDLASGIYSYSLEANGQKEWKKCVIIK